MRYYECLFIVNPNVEQDRLTQLLDTVTKEINNLSGNILNVEDWGKRRLAYQIKKHKYGNYILVQFETENTKIVKELGDWMKLNQNILSHIIVVLDEKPGQPAPAPVAENAA